MNKTKIEWVKNPDGSQGYTWNPITGCLNGCEYCYARKLANGRLKARYLANGNYAPMTVADIDNPFYPRFWEDRLYEPVNKIRRWGRQSQVVHRQEPKGIFVCDMSDLFGIGIPEEWTRRILDRFQYCPQHRFYLLSKQPQNLLKFSPFPENCWVGVTATDQEQYYDAVSNIAGIEAKVKFVSFEPLLEQINGGECAEEYRLDSIEEFDWLIIGAQTKPYKPPELGWVQEIVKAADQAGIPAFLKNNLSDLIPVNSSLRYGPAGELRLRQEMPK